MPAGTFVAEVVPVQVDLAIAVAQQLALDCAWKVQRPCEDLARGDDGRTDHRHDSHGHEGRNPSTYPPV
jgi:hypothetical protein